MNKLNVLIALLILSISFSCANRHLSSNEASQEEELSALVELMTGKFSSEKQALRDTLFYDISLQMFPIWEKNKEAKWLYVEQAVTQYLDRPYRQRVYKVTKTTDGRFESRVYELPNPENYIHAWDKPAIFDQITPDSLVVRTGCAVFLEKNDENCYTGSTNEQDCKSDFRGAEYATSIVTICSDEVVSWDQGWDGDSNQVWGAETEGYIFDRIE